jgi:hypothetical protein
MKYQRNKILALFIVIMMVNSICAQEEVPLYGLYVVPSKAETVVTLNGFPFAETHYDQDISSSGRVNRFLKQGENIIRIEFDDTKMALPENEDETSLFLLVELKSRANYDEESIEESIFRVERQVDFGTKGENPRKEFITIQTVDGDQEVRSPLLNSSQVVVTPGLGPIQYRQDDSTTTSVFEIRFHLDSVPVDSLPWLTGPTIVDPDALETIRDKIMSMHNSFVNRNPDGVISAMGEKLTRMAISEGTTGQAVGNVLRESYIQLVFTIPGLDFAPVNRETIQAVNVNGLNLFKVVVNDNAPIQATGEDWEFSLPVYFSNVGDSWVVVE